LNVKYLIGKLMDESPELRDLARGKSQTEAMTTKIYE
jgi:hypothetical protein